MGRGRRRDHNGVGQSDGRTPGKHDVLNALLGLEVGVGQHFSNPVPLFIDLCAGDGNPQAVSANSIWPRGRSSPELMLYHAAMAERGRSGRAYVWLFEDDSSFKNRKGPRSPYDTPSSESLLFNCRMMRGPQRPGSVMVIKGDSRERLVEMKIPSDVGHIFIFNDPQSIATWAMTTEILNHLYRTTDMVTTLSAVGGNAGGVARMRARVAEQWQERLWLPYYQTPSHHDAMIAMLNKDNHRWAYILSGPAVWRDKYEKTVAAAFRCWKPGIDASWADGQAWHEYDRIVNYIVPITEDDPEISYQEEEHD